MKQADLCKEIQKSIEHHESEMKKAAWRKDEDAVQRRAGGISALTWVLGLLEVDSKEPKS